MRLGNRGACRSLGGRMLRRLVRGGEGAQTLCVWELGGWSRGIAWIGET
jgi:hypothetical protein